MPEDLPTLSDGVIELRVPSSSDAAALMAEQDDQVVQWLTGHRFTLIEAIEWIELVRECWLDGEHRRNFGVFELASGALVGGIEAHSDWTLVEGIEQGEANVGFWIGPSGRGKGHAVRSVALVTQYLASLGLARALIRTRPENAAANRVAARAGFSRTSTPGDDLARWYLDLA